MKILVTSILLLINLFSASGQDSQASSNNEPLQYYKFLTKQGVDISLKIDKLGKYLSEYSKIAKNCVNYQLDKDRFDTINNLFSESSKLVSKGIFGILSLKEVDSDLSLKGPVLDMFKEFNKILSDYMPIFLSGFQTGTKNYSQEQFTLIKDTNDNMLVSLQNVIKQGELFDVIATEFKTKYGFTEFDVMKNGL